ncbi:MAG: hypothetical protein MUF74_12175 [Cypionkella sp.]|nr:hypothetical protein [Cypionkella sp.]
MKRAFLSFALLTLALPAFANGPDRPDRPTYQTDAETCVWTWQEGGGFGLWAEACTFNGTLWQVLWDADQGAFVTQQGTAQAGIAVQPWTLPDASGITALSALLIAAGHLAPEAACTWQPVAPRPAPRTMAFHSLTPTDPAALAPTPEGEVPEPVCGPYGASTHGVRYVITDLRWPGQAVFVEEGQERPLFDPASITRLP